MPRMVNPRTFEKRIGSFRGEGNRAYEPYVTLCNGSCVQQYHRDIATFQVLIMIKFALQSHILFRTVRDEHCINDIQHVTNC
jgi:hypothetical protein